MHLFRPLGHRVAKGREADKGHAGIQPHVPGHTSSAFGNRRQIVLIRPFMHQRIANQHDPALMQQRGHAGRAVFGIGVKDVVDLIQNMRGFAGGTGDQTIAMPMRQHQRREDVPVTAHQTVDVLTVEALALQAVEQEILVGVEMLGVGGIDHLQFAHRIAKAGGLQLGLHIIGTANDQRLAKAGPLIGNGSAQHTGIVALGKDHPRLGRARAGVEAAQDRSRRVHPAFQADLIGFHVDDGTTRGTRIHARLGHGWGNPVDQTRIKRCRDDVIATKSQRFAISKRHLIRHILARQCGQRMSTSDLHLVVDGARIDVQRAAEQVGKAQNVVHLVGIVRAARGDDGVDADLVGLFRGDFGIRVCHGKDHRVVGHGGNHLLRHRAFDRHAKENIGAFHCFLKRPQLSLDRMGRLPLVHTFGTALIDHTLGVTDDAVVMPRAHGFQQLDTGDTCRTRAVEHDLHVFDLLARNMQRIDQARRTDHSGTVLVVMEDGDIHLFLQALLDDETLGRLDVFKVDAAKGRAHQLDRVDELVRIFGVELNVDRVHIGKAFEQDRFPLHHRFRSQRAQVSKPQNRRPVGDDSHQVALVGIIIGGFRVRRDRFAWHRNTGGIGQGEIPLRGHRDGRIDFPFAGCRLQMEGKRLFVCDLRFGHGL